MISQLPCPPIDGLIVEVHFETEYVDGLVHAISKELPLGTWRYGPNAVASGLFEALRLTVGAAETEPPTATSV